MEAVLEVDLGIGLEVDVRAAAATGFDADAALAVLPGASVAAERLAAADDVGDWARRVAGLAGLAGLADLPAALAVGVVLSVFVALAALADWPAFMASPATSFKAAAAMP